jgi:hypothetical protein
MEVVSLSFLRGTFGELSICTTFLSSDFLNQFGCNL